MEMQTQVETVENVRLGEWGDGDKSEKGLG